MAATYAQKDTAMDEIKDQENDQSAVAPRSEGPIGRLKNFYHDVVSEMKKVSWPTQQEVINTTMVVIVAVFFFAFYMFAADIVLTYFIKGLEWVAGKIFG
jgi:preprotein translocase subunit SecE